VNIYFDIPKEVLNRLFKVLARTQVCRGKSIEIFPRTYMREVDCDDLADVVISLRSFILWVELSRWQWDCIFASISTVSECSLELNALGIDRPALEDPLQLNCFIEITDAWSHLLAPAVCRLHTVKLSYALMTAEQIDEIMSMIVKTEQQDLKLHTLYLQLICIYYYESDFDDEDEVERPVINPDLLAKGICKLHTVYLGGTELTRDQTCTLMATVANTTELRLHKIDLRVVNLSSVPVSILAKAVCRLHTVNLLDTNLSVSQVTALLTEIVKNTGIRLQKLTVDEELIMEVDQNLVVKAKLIVDIHVK